MLNIKRQILTSYWVKGNETVITYGTVNAARMLKDGYELVQQELPTYVMTEQQFAETGKRKEI